MNQDILKGQWKQFKGSIQKTFGKLTDDHLDQIAGDRDRFLGSIQEQYGIARDEADLRLKQWEKDQRDSEKSSTQSAA